jgi:hypothetical protein
MMSESWELARRHALPSDREQLLAERDRVKRRFGPLYDGVLEILQRYNPTGIGIIANDEYEPEVDTILLRLGEAHSLGECRHIIHEEFVWWFSDSAAESWEKRLMDNDAGPEEKYQGIAEEVWSLWTAQSSNRDANE